MVRGNLIGSVREMEYWHLLRICDNVRPGNTSQRLYSEYRFPLTAIMRNFASSSCDHCAIRTVDFGPLLAIFGFVLFFRAAVKPAAYGSSAPLLTELSPCCAAAASLSFRRFPFG